MNGWPSRVVGVVAKGQTWLNAAYLLIGFPLGLAYFITLVVGISVGIALAVLIVGLGILLATLAAWRAFAAIERGLARGLLGVPIPHPPSDRRDLPIIDRVRRWLRDPVTWKSLVFVALKFPLGLASFVAVVCLGGFALILLFAPVIVIWTPVTVFGWIVTSWTEALPLFVAGVPAVLLVLHMCNGLAWLWALFARVMLGPSTVQLHERVDTLRDARVRIIAAADAERRRIERNLHDGAQQRLVALSLTLGMAESRLPADPDGAASLIGQAREEAALAVKELRELASGIHPALLTERGLGPALEALAARSPVPTTVDGVPEFRLPPPVESTAYFVTAEALTNVAKYAGATTANVTLAVEHGRLLLLIRDDGAGGADPAAGSGLRGLRDRVEALDGQLHIDSPAGLGTTLIAEIPIGGHNP
ncbi:MAG TPA: sensor domain-containing protein [Solirubrobacteraceae bacterium]|nr:sensor domain-containing protein [Solirubrobacteraceae bacterium]